MRCTLEPGDKIVDCPPTFTMYKFDAAVNGAEVVTIPRLDNFKLDVQGEAELRIRQYPRMYIRYGNSALRLTVLTLWGAGVKLAVEQHCPKIIFLTSPNNPDGSVISETELLEILSLPVLVVLDEAYIEFCDEPSRLNWVSKYHNLVVLRTFSKCAALAGLRVGYGAFPLDMIQYIWRAKQPYNVSVAAEVAGVAALSNLEYMVSVRDALVNERQRLFEALKEISFLDPSPSQANFILCRVTDGRDAAELRRILAQDFGIMVRHYATKELNGFIRISVGLPEHTDKLLAALKQLT